MAYIIGFFALASADAFYLFLVINDRYNTGLDYDQFINEVLLLQYNRMPRTGCPENGKSYRFFEIR